MTGYIYLSINKFHILENILSCYLPSPYVLLAHNNNKRA
jgi:hypothetical protein